MVDILRRSFAPITEKAWEEIDKEAIRVLKSNLSARYVVDVTGPKGWKFGVIDLGRLVLSDEQPIDGVSWGIRQVMPLVEFRTKFKLSTMELDDISRGCEDPDFESLDEAAKKSALFEEAVIFNGFESAGIDGILKATEREPIELSANAGELAAGVADAVESSYSVGIGGPFGLILGNDLFGVYIKGTESGYPISKRIDHLVEGKVLWSPALSGGVLLSKRGGDFELTLGQDMSIGFDKREDDKLKFYITQSFTFRVLEPKAAVELKIKR